MAPSRITTVLKALAQAVMGAFLLFTGTGHLTFSRSEFLAQVPPWFPVDGDLVVLISGVIELALGAALLTCWTARWRWLAGAAAAAFFVAIFPGNISQYLTHTSAFGLDTDTKRAVRLLFQPVLVAWALWATGAWPELRRRIAARNDSRIS